MKNTVIKTFDNMCYLTYKLVDSLFFTRLVCVHSPGKLQS